MFIGGGILKEIYLDNSATTKVYEQAAEAAFKVMTENYGNPSSLRFPDPSTDSSPSKFFAG